MEKQEIERFPRSLRGKEISRVTFSCYMNVSKQGDVVIINFTKKDSLAVCKLTFNRRTLPLF